MKRLAFYAAPLGGLALVFSFALGGDLAVRAAERPTLAAISQGLTCQCGCGLTVANCNHPTCSFSVPVREQIEAMIGKGKSGTQIIAFYRQKYGEKILSAPTT
jgi:cytochrome c-type biogenesis protein CcmH/NrfF